MDFSHTPNDGCDAWRLKVGTAMLGLLVVKLRFLRVCAMECSYVSSASVSTNDTRKYTYQLRKLQKSQQRAALQCIPASARKVISSQSDSPPLAKFRSISVPQHTHTHTHTHIHTYTCEKLMFAKERRMNRAYRQHQRICCSSAVV